MAITVTIPHLLCNLELASHSNDTDWVHGANNILYYAYPVVLTLGIIFGLLNAVVTAKMASTSHECFLAAFNVSATLLLVVASMHHLPAYASRKVSGGSSSASGTQAASADVGAYQLTVAPYLPALHSLFSVTCTWLLAAVALQRTLSGLAANTGSGTGRRRDAGLGDGGCLPMGGGAVGKRLCGVLASTFVLVVALVVSLPQFWEFEVADLRSEHVSGGGIGGESGSAPPLSSLPHNCTVTRGGLARRADSLVAGYLWYDWFFLVVSFVLPYVILPMMLPPIACSPHYIYTYAATGDGSSRQKVKYRPGSSQRTERKEARDFDRLLTAVIVFYLVLSLPANTANTLASPPAAAAAHVAARAGSEGSNNLLLGFASQLTSSTLRTVLDVTAYSFFSISFFVYLGFSDKYRTSLYGLCCCQKVAQPYYY